MALILHIETATEVCSVAVSNNKELLAIKETVGGNSHSANLTTFIEEVIKQAGITLQQLDAVAVSKGPGSYTGLRIGISTAKGLCYGLDIPMIAVDTLKAMAWGASNGNDADVLYCPMIDARRMEVYAGVYDKNNTTLREVKADIVDDTIYKEYLDNNIVMFFGNGAEKCRELLSTHSNAKFMDNNFASAPKMISLAADKYEQKQFEDVAYFEPFYLKDFIAAKPVVKGLH